jgi:1,4-dihydroxy-2-naphthoate octaprenyltransferase
MASSIPLSEILLRTPTLNEGQWQSLSWSSKWLVMVRAVVLVMTVLASAIGIVMAAVDGFFFLDRALVLVLGLLFAHATNNLLNDWIDHRKGIDRDNYFRRRYGVQVLEDGLMELPMFAVVTMLTGMIAILCAAFLIMEVGMVVGYLSGIGAFFVLFYTWPLKHFALGEVSVLIVWGPLLVAGSYFTMAGSVSPEVLLVSLIYGIGPTLVIMGKHLDKFDDDTQRNVHSLPVVIGQSRSRYLSLGLILVQWVLLGAAIIKFSMFWLLICGFSLPVLIKLIRSLGHAAPKERPDHFPRDVWPLWYSAFSFAYMRNFGVLLFLGLILKLLFAIAF